ncbi:hypothetical protein VXS03_12990 [Photobacterium sp. S4TG1]|uniref:hypothetical protein n=1 Tax=Photobacterium sp. S4TG1 TaxID=3114587 RepID=UPI002E1900DF|nr:hypothetical protein [Photobacterium sp. S4TG1]
MKAWLLKIPDRKRLIMASVIAMLLVTISLFTVGVISALCDLTAFAILLTVLWIKAGKIQSQNKPDEQVVSSVKIKIEP